MSAYVVVGRVLPDRVDFEARVVAGSEDQAIRQWAQTARECGYSPVVSSARARAGAR